MKSEFRIRVEPSRLLRIALGSMLGLSMAALWYVGTLGFAYFACVLTSFVVFLCVSRHVIRRIFRPEIWSEVRVRENFSLVLDECSKSGDCVVSREVLIATSSKAWPFLVLLHLFGEDGTRHYFCVLSDCMSDHDFRRLKVLVRFARQRLPSNILALDQL